MKSFTRRTPGENEESRQFFKKKLNLPLSATLIWRDLTGISYSVCLSHAYFKDYSFSSRFTFSSRINDFKQQILTSHCSICLSELCPLHVHAKGISVSGKGCAWWRRNHRFQLINNRIKFIFPCAQSNCFHKYTFLVIFDHRRSISCHFCWNWVFP